VTQALGIALLLVQLAPIYLAGAGVFDSETRKPVPMEDLPDAADLALHWVPGLCVWTLVQALAIDLLGTSVGAFVLQLRLTRANGGEASPGRWFAREVLRIAPCAGTLVVAGVLSGLDRPAASYWVLFGGLGVALMAATLGAVVVVRGGPSLLDAVTDTRLHRGRPADLVTA
jgi:hypothetical protein